MIEDIQLYQRGNQTQSLLDHVDYLARTEMKPCSVTVPPGGGNLLIHFSAIDFEDPARVRYRYRMLGVDDQWIDAKQTRSAIYAGLSPGAFRFEVQAANKHGLSGPPAALQLNVLPFWWETKSVQGFAFLVLAGTVYSVIATRFNRLKREKTQQISFTRRLLEKEETERKRIARSEPIQWHCLFQRGFSF